MNSDYGLYAYGLVNRHAEQLDMLGIDKKHKVYPILGKDMCVVVSKIEIELFQNQVKQLFSAWAKTADDAQSETKELLQAHEDVVDTLMLSSSVVPFTFGTILKDEKAAAKLLEDDQEKFTALLAKFTGKAEWGLKIYVDNQAFMNHIVRNESTYTNRGEQQEKCSDAPCGRQDRARGTAYLLGRKRSEELKENVIDRLAEVTEGIFQELEQDAFEAKLNKTLPQKLTGKKQEMMLNAVYLVERGRVACFCKRGRELQEKSAAIGISLEVSGPWPPYSFI